MDCRFNKPEIIHKIEIVAKMGKQITLLNRDANDMIVDLVQRKTPNLFLNIDPPYVIKGRQLYTSFYKNSDHRALATTIADKLCDVPWIITYDDCQLIRDIYADFHMQEYMLMHNAGGSNMGKELVITNLQQDKFVW